MDLSASGVAVVPTTWVEPGTSWSPPESPFVVKPAISAGGRETARYDHHDAGDAEAHVRRLNALGQTAMVQPYLCTVDAIGGGETKIVCIDGRFSHAVRVGPLLDPGAGVMVRPWEKPVAVAPSTPSPEQLALAETAIGHVRERFGETPLYARVDIVDDGHPAVLELELIDPSLSLWARPSAAHALAAAISVLIEHPPLAAAGAASASVRGEPEVSVVDRLVHGAAPVVAIAKVVTDRSGARRSGAAPTTTGPKTPRREGLD